MLVRRSWPVNSTEVVRLRLSPSFFPKTKQHGHTASLQLQRFVKTRLFRKTLVPFGEQAGVNDAFVGYILGSPLAISVDCTSALAVQSGR